MTGGFGIEGFDALAAVTVCFKFARRITWGEVW
jgi:hypothetical protein